MNIYLIIDREQWPGAIEEYDIILYDGCTFSRLHNLSDRPSNFPTLDTLPRSQWPPNYSDAYDSKEMSGSHLRINHIVEGAVANTAHMIASGQSVPPSMGMTWEAQHPTVRLAYLLSSCYYYIYSLHHQMVYLSLHFILLLIL